MTNAKEQLKAFINEVKPTQTLWALVDRESEDWVVVDSGIYESTDTMPLWSSEEKALACCVDQWDAFIPKNISLSDFFEFWVEDLNQDGVCIGINWQGENTDEMELTDFAQAVAQIETL